MTQSMIDPAPSPTTPTTPMDIAIQQQIANTTERYQENTLLAGIPEQVTVGGTDVQITSWSLTRLIKLDDVKFKFQKINIEYDKVSYDLDQERRALASMDTASEEFWTKWDEIQERASSDEHRQKERDAKKKLIDALYELVYHIVNDDVNNPTHELDWIKDKMTIPEGQNILTVHTRLNDLENFIEQAKDMKMLF